MNADEARRLLTGHDAEDGPVWLPPTVLADLSSADLPEGVAVEVGSPKDGAIHIEWEGRLFRDGTAVTGEADYVWTRKYWYSPLGLEQYLDLVRRAVETRQRIRGDVQLTHYDDDGAYIHLSYAIQTNETNLRRAYDAARAVARELEEVAEQAVNEVGARIAEVAARLSGWGADSLDTLVDRVATAKNTDDKGRSLEELCSRLFASVPGLTVTGRLRTATEEIDISIINDSGEPRLRRESALILAECKNWSGVCGKNEFVIFREKLENRNQRCSLGFLISWNGFAGTVTKEMLRGSREDLLVVPVSGEDVRAAVMASDFPSALVKWWDRAVTL
jgi:hypothetical protein